MYMCGLIVVLVWLPKLSILDYHRTLIVLSKGSRLCICSLWVGGSFSMVAKISYHPILIELQLQYYRLSPY